MFLIIRKIPIMNGGLVLVSQSSYQAYVYMTTVQIRLDENKNKKVIRGYIYGALKLLEYVYMYACNCVTYICIYIPTAGP